MNCNKNYQTNEKNNQNNSHKGDLSPSEELETIQLFDEGIIVGGTYGRCETDCAICRGIYLDGNEILICKCKCHKAEKHIKERIIRFYLYNNTDFNKGLHILDKYKLLGHRIEKILISKYKVDRNKKNLIPNVEIQNISESNIVFIDKPFFKSDKLLYYELKEIGKEETSTLFKFAFNNICNTVTIDTVILK